MTTTFVFSQLTSEQEKLYKEVLKARNFKLIHWFKLKKN